jgi:hypothetical protein
MALCRWTYCDTQDRVNMLFTSALCCGIQYDSEVIAAATAARCCFIRKHCQHAVQLLRLALGQIVRLATQLLAVCLSAQLYSILLKQLLPASKSYGIGQSHRPCCVCCCGCCCCRRLCCRRCPVPLAAAVLAVAPAWAAAAVAAPRVGLARGPPCGTACGSLMLSIWCSQRSSCTRVATSLPVYSFIIRPFTCRDTPHTTASASLHGCRLYIHLMHHCFAQCIVSRSSASRRCGSEDQQQSTC